MLRKVDFDNYKLAIDVQRKIFPHEDGTLNILASLDRNLFINITKLYYPDDNVKYYLAYEDDEIRGITGLYYFDNLESWIAWFGILPQFRGMGYGKKVLEETLELAKSEGFKFMRLYTDKEDNKDAIKLYEKMGFVGEKYTREKLSYDCYIYSKSLSGEKVQLLNNRNLNLSYQSDLDQMDKKRINDILDLYDNR